MSATRHLFVNTGSVEAADGSATDPSLVADGKIAILDQIDSSSGSEDLTTANNGEKFTIVRGGDNPLVEHIDKDKITAVRVTDYRAEVQQETEIKFDDSNNVDAAMEGTATLKFVDVTDGFEPFPRVTASVKVELGDTYYDIATALSNQINANPQAFVTLTVDGAAGKSTGVATITAKADLSEDGEPATSFQTASSGLISGIDISGSVDPVTASGSYEQMKNLEEFSWGSQKSFYMTNYFPQTPDSNLAPGQTYDLAVVEYKNDNDHAVINQNDTRQIYFAFPSSTSGAANIKTFFGV